MRSLKLTRTTGRVFLAITLMFGFQARIPAQVAPAKEGSMLTPAPVSVSSYPKEVGAEERSNYLRLGLLFSAGYIDNLFTGAVSPVLGETFFSIRPIIAYDMTSYRLQSSLTYTPGFTFYRPTSSLSQTDQKLIFDFRYRVTPNGVIEANDNFQQGAGSFDPTAGSGGASGSPGTIIVSPFAQILTNTLNGQYSLQVSPTSMLGITGRISDLHYPDTAQVPGLSDSLERGGGGFYNLRLTSNQYIGVNYRYTDIAIHPQSDTQIQNTYLYYAIYPGDGLSISAAAGPENYNAEFTPLGSPNITSKGWTPGVTASIGWQRSHTNFSVLYARSVSAGNGLIGTFNTQGASAAARWQALRTWTFGASANYSNLKSLLSSVSAASGGHSITGTVTVDHPLGAHFGAKFEYDRLHQSYGGVPVAISNPDSNREMISIYWQFARPLGR